MKFTPTCLLVGALYFIVHCDSALEAEDDSNVDIEYTDPSLLLNNIQLSSKSTFARASAFGGELTRMYPMYGSIYRNAFSVTNFDGLYSDIYTDVFIDTQSLSSLTATKNFITTMG